MQVFWPETRGLREPPEGPPGWASPKGLETKGDGVAAGGIAECWHKFSGGSGAALVFKTDLFGSCFGNIRAKITEGLCNIHDQNELRPSSMTLRSQGQPRLAMHRMLAHTGVCAPTMHRQNQWRTRARLTDPSRCTRLSQARRTKPNSGPYCQTTRS